MSAVDARRTVLVVGGLGGLLGRAVGAELAGNFEVRSLHRRPGPGDAGDGISFVAGDAGTIPDWAPLLEGVDAVVLLAWYRSASPRAFQRLADGIERLLSAAGRAGVRRVVHVSVPEAPPALERTLPYLREKRRVDQAVVASGIPYRILRPSAVFGPGDVLLGVMMRTIHRWGRLPMFGDGRYHLSPIASADVGRAIRLGLDGGGSGIEEAGGPERFEYRELAERMFAALGRPPRYLRLSPRGGHRLARLLELAGSSLLYAYEVDWLVSDRLGLPPLRGLDRPLAPVDAYLRSVAERL
ncbi:MAG TPA: NAD(P)H-binding protein [Thermoplasmata archaeon]|nr:NAD(P)H-binding protein [Thermoplasmata archaeon]